MGGAMRRKTQGVSDVFAAGRGERPVEDDEALFSFPAVRRRFRDEELLDDILRFAEAFPPEERSAVNYLAWPRRRFHTHTIAAQLGGWVEALRLAGVDYAVPRARGPSREQVEDELRRFAQATPVPERTKDRFKDWKGRRISVVSIGSHFGTWHDALRALDIAVPGRTKSRKHSDEELLAAVERVWRWRERPPSHKDFVDYARVQGEGLSYGTVYHRFGPVKPFLAAFAEWKRGRMTEAQLLSWGRRRARASRAIPVSVRYRVLRAHDHTCAACGRSPRNTPGLMLEVDHIVPVSRGGADSEDNLQVLCFACNRGKGSR